jgi:hypothetical protein
VVTITVTAAPSNLVVGGGVNIANVQNAGYDGTALIVTGPGAPGTIVTGTTFTYTLRPRDCRPLGQVERPRAPAPRNAD